jgi:hypothetical protein
MPAVFENIIDLVGGLIEQEKKKKKKVRVVPSKYPASAISEAPKPRLPRRPVIIPGRPIIIGPGRPRMTAEAKALSRRAREVEARRLKEEEKPSPALSALTSTVARAYAKRKPKKAKKAKAEEAKEEELYVDPLPLWFDEPEEGYAAVRPSELKFTPGKESGRNIDGTWKLSSSKGREGAAAEARGEIPPTRVSPFATAKREKGPAPPATKKLTKTEKAQIAEIEKSLIPLSKAKQKKQDAKAKALKAFEGATLGPPPELPELPPSKYATMFPIPPPTGAGLRKRRRKKN